MTTQTPNALYLIIKYMHIWTPCLALLIAFSRSRLFGRISLQRFTRQLLAQLIFWVIGIESLVIFIIHTWFPGIPSSVMGWSSTTLIYQMGMVNLSFGILGIASMLTSIGFKTATTLGYAIWIFGDGIGHLIGMLTHSESAQQVGLLLYTDLIIPLLLVVLLMSTHQTYNSKA